MATYRGRKSDISRKVGFNIWGKPKCPSGKRPYKPGQHGPDQRMDNRQSEFGEQLLAKQVIKRYYGMLERQFRNTFEKAHRMHGNTGLNFLRLLELRLQTAVYRLGYANTIFQARQVVSHGHVTVNGKRVDVPSYTLKVGDVVSLANGKSREIAKRNHYEGAAVPVYMEPDVANMSAKVVALPERDDFPQFFDEQKVVEFYAR
jgi:small subunit ribosomal protein S4